MSDKILVFPSSTEIGYEIRRSFEFVKNIKLCGASDSFDRRDSLLYEEFFTLPSVSNEQACLDALNAEINIRGITHIFPAHDDATYFLSKNKDKLKAKVLALNFDVVDVLRYKSKTYDLLTAIVPTPLYFHDKSNGLSDSDFPVFCKPDRGQGSQGVCVAYSRNDLPIGGYIYCELLTGDEYTIDCLSDNNGNLIYSMGRIRKATRNGISTTTEFVADDEFITYAKLISDCLSIKGAWFFQMKRDKSGKLKLLEVAPRVAGTMGLARARGVNLPLLHKFIFDGCTVDVIENDQPNRVMRSLEQTANFSIPKVLYMDFDDTLVKDGLVNSHLLSFVFTVYNKCGSVVLITRHANVLSSSLSKYRLSGVFDRVIHITNQKKKSEFIKADLEQYSVKPYGYILFVDDSFSERKDVSDSLGIDTVDHTAFC